MAYHGKTMGFQPDTRDLSPKKVIVIGGGLAGLSASIRLLEHGLSVTLVERRPFLGGRTFSFREKIQNLEIDNGQHVFLGCCTYYRTYLETIGSAPNTYLPNKLQCRIVRDGVTGTISSIPWLRRFHLLPSFLKYPHLTSIDKIRVLYGLARIGLIRRSESQTANLVSESFYNWLKRHHQSDQAIENFWNLFILPTLNDDIQVVSADMGIMVFKETFLKGAENASVGLTKIGLTSLNGDPAQHYIESRNGEVVLGCNIRKILVENGQVHGIKFSNGNILKGDVYISALPHQSLLEILPRTIRDAPQFSGVENLTYSPILGIHLWYDREIMEEDFVAFLDSPVQWVFNKYKIQGIDCRNDQYLCVSISGAWEFINTPKKELIKIFSIEMARLFPKAADANLKYSYIVKERNATFRSLPGTAQHRPSQETIVPNLYLAGDWTQTGWPSTMEGAVRSGFFAADLVARQKNTKT